MPLNFWQDRTVRIGIITSVLSTMLVIFFIQPLLSAAWRFSSVLASHFFQSYYDGLYSNAALGHRNWLEFALFAFSVSLILGMTSGVLTSLAARKFLFRKDVRGWLFSSPFRLIALSVVLLLALLFSSASLLVRAYADLQLNTSFQQRLTVIAPHLTEQEEEELLAMWASMQTRANYNQINEKLESHARANDVTLPDPLIQ